MPLTDYKQHKALYLTCFPEDSAADAEFLFQTVLSKAECVSEYDGDRLVAMLFLMESGLCTGRGELPFYYLYAACTDPAYRGRGIMRRLLGKAQALAVQKGKDGIFLKPANPPLFGFYAQSGFRPFFQCLKITGSTDDFFARYRAFQDRQGLPCESEIALEPCSLDDWYQRRLTLLPRFSDCYATLRKPLFRAATDGCQVVSDPKVAFAVYETREDLLLIKEAIAPPEEPHRILTIAAALLCAGKQKRVEIRTPVSDNDALLLAFGFQRTDFSVIWDAPLPESLSAERPYHGFAFD